MRKISKMLIALIAGGLMVASAQAALVINQNPHGLDIQAVTAVGADGWDFANDTLGLAYANGQVDVVTPDPVVWGVAENMVDGLGTGAGLIMYNGFTASFTLNGSYAGPRTLGTVDGQYGHALRVGMTNHESYNNYKLQAFYQTTDAVGTWELLFDVEGLDTQPAWNPTTLFINTDAASMAIENIHLIAIKSFAVLQSDGGNYGADLKELDVNMIPEPASMVLIGLSGLGFAFIRRFRV